MTTAAAAFPPPTICRSTRGISSVVPTAKGRLAASRLGSWGDAEQLPGSRWLSAQGQQVRITALSCASAGNCAAGGLAGSEAFVANEKDGTWGSPAKVRDWIGSICATTRRSPLFRVPRQVTAAPGATTARVLVTQPAARWGPTSARPLSSTSTTASGGCRGGAGPGPTQRGWVCRHHFCVVCRSGRLQRGWVLRFGTDKRCHGRRANGAFLVDEVDGTWDEAEEVLHMGALNRGGRAEVTSLSCGAIGYCSAGGHFNDGERQRASSSARIRVPGRARSSFPVWHALTRADQPRSARCPVRQSDTARRAATSWRVPDAPLASS